MSEHDQSFKSFDEWVDKGRSWLTRRGPYEHAACFDTEGNACLCGADFRHAQENGLFPVRWIWPDQVGKLAVASGWRAEA